MLLRACPSELLGASELRHYAGYQMAMVDGIDQRAEDKIERLKAIVAENEGGYVDASFFNT